MFTDAQIRTFQRALAHCSEKEPHIERLERMVQYAPQFADRVAELRARHDNLKALALMGITINDTNQQGQV